MFDAQDHPRVFALPPGVDFPHALLNGLVQRHQSAAPEALARVHLIVNTRRMARRLREMFDAGPPRLLPRITLLTDMDALAPTARRAVRPALARRLQLAQLIRQLIDAQPDLAPRAAIFDLAGSLADLLDEMQGEGVDPQVIQSLDISDMSGHWARTQQFISIVQDYLASSQSLPDPAAHQRKTVKEVIERWQTSPPAHPIIVAGSTGSRGTAQLLMQAVARLPQGAVVLPGYDFDLPQRVWGHLDHALTAEDHPQFRYRTLMRGLNLSPDQITRWTNDTPASPPRNAVLSLALRPAPVTDAWLSEGPTLSDLPSAFEEVTLIEAPSPRSEALAIALRLRQAAQDNVPAALITPDRMLTRQVTAALDQWGITPDDSAGLPLHLSAPGRFLRHVANLFVTRLDAQAVLTLLKHPLCHSGAGRGNHLLRTRDLELHLRRNGPPFPDAAMLQGWAADQDSVWGAWLAETIPDQCDFGSRPLADWTAQLVTLAETLCAGSGATGSGELWDKNAGHKARAAISELTQVADQGGDMSARDFAELVSALLSQGEVRDRDAPHTGIMIWGTLEARVQGADLLILGGLNEGTWPEASRPDPWLNRALRHQAGLLLPERRIGLSAHDFQQAAAAPEVWLTRSIRSSEAETVAARWLNRLTNLLDGLPAQNGPKTLGSMRARGATWLRYAEALEAAPPLPAAPRPSPRPPTSARPRALSVTEIKRLIRDPYAIYAKHVLRLRPLDPIVQAPDALLRGIVVHEVLETFIRDTPLDQQTQAMFIATAQGVLAAHVPWPTARIAWMARIERIAPLFLRSEALRRAVAQPIAFEARTKADLPSLGMTLTGVADRIDRDAQGRLHIFDYKTGTPPSAREQAKFDKQLLIEAAIAERCGFQNVPPAPVEQAVFIGLGGTPRDVAAPLGDEPTGKVWEDLHTLLAAYLSESQGFTARRMMQRDTDQGDYDQLARFGEWDMTQAPEPEDLT